MSGPTPPDSPKYDSLTTTQPADENVQSQAVVRSQVPSTEVPSFVLGSLGSGSIAVPVKLGTTKFQFKALDRKAWKISASRFPELDRLRDCFGFSYWRFLSVEIMVLPAVPFAAVNLIGGWTFERGTDLTKPQVEALATSRIYQLRQGTPLLLECPFGSLISRNITSQPIVGGLPELCMSTSVVNLHPYIPTGPNHEPTQPAFPAEYILWVRVVGEAICSQPQPALLGL